MACRDKFPVGDVIHLLIHSPGGHADPAYKAMKFFRKRFKTVVAIVPLYAKSAATLMCLGADKIFMGEFAELGPLDVQINDPVEKGLEPSLQLMTLSQWNISENTLLRL